MLLRDGFRRSLLREALAGSDMAPSLLSSLAMKSETIETPESAVFASAASPNRRRILRLCSSGRNDCFPAQAYVRYECRSDSSLGIVTVSLPDNRVIVE